MEDTREILELIQQAQTILVIQGENPDGDSVASSLALEEILESAGKQVVMYCAVDVPKHLRYMVGWDRVVNELPKDFDATIIVDTAAEVLLERTFSDHNLPILRSRPTIVIDHHDVDSTMPYQTLNYVSTSAAATGEAIYDLLNNDYNLSLGAKRFMAISILYDTRGLSTEATTPKTIRLIADFVEAGISLAELDEARMEMNRRDEDIARYKGELLQRIEVDNEIGLATVEITWEEIEQYSDRYNPAVLVLDEMRLITGVSIAIAYKTYPDGKLLAKIRSNRDAPIAAALAERFDGGGHPNAAGFKLRGRDFNEVKQQVRDAIRELQHDR